MDFLACIGKTGLLYPIKGVAPESDEAMIALLGNDVFKVHRGRGPLEAYGANIPFKKGEVVLRANFAHLLGEEIYNNRLKDIRSLPTKEELDKLKQIKLNNIRYYPTINYRGVLIIKEKLSPKVTNSHPGYKIIRNYITEAQIIKDKKIKLEKIKPLENNARKTAQLLNEYTLQVKSKLKTKTLLLRGAGNELPRLKKQKGKWVIISDMPVEKAIGKLSGMQVKKTPKNLRDYPKEVLNCLKKYDSIYLQLKGPDAYGHQGDPIKKAKEIERIDKEFFNPLIKNINLSKTIICVTGDHSTPCSFMAHSNHPCPLLITGLGKDKTSSFSEKVARKGGLSEVIGGELLDLLS